MKKNNSNIKGGPSTLVNSECAKSSSEIEQQFEVELYWCINQLQKALTTGKLNPKQIQEHTKALNTLMSKSAPIIKKRQVMRLSFGDYRSLMASEEKKHAKLNEKVKLVAPTPNAKSSKSKFVRKATGNALSSNFKFNFNESLMMDDNESATNGQIEDKCEKLTLENNINFIPSSDGFKFNFDVTDCDS